MKLQRYFLITVLSLFSSVGVCDLPKNGVLPTKGSAIKVAEIVLVQIYGEKVLDQRPFAAKLVDGFWIIDGTLHCTNGDHCLGDVAHIEINKEDGKVRAVIHGK